MSYFSLYYHFVWHTNGSLPILKNEARNHVWEIIKSIIINSAQMFYVSIGGTEDHIHSLVYSRSTITVAKMAQLMKGTSSEIINKKKIFAHWFAWQHEYGCVTVDKRDIDTVISYIYHQQEHHAQRSTDIHFESTDFRDFDYNHAWGNET